VLDQPVVTAVETRATVTEMATPQRGCAVSCGKRCWTAAHGADLQDELWSASCLVAAPHLIRKVRPASTERERERNCTLYKIGYDEL
jgi:hypothetical protein